MGPAYAIVLSSGPEPLPAIEALREHEFRVETYQQLASFMDMAARSHPDLLLADYRSVSDFVTETCRTVRSVRETESVPLILINCPASEDLRLAALESGADDWLPAEMTEHELLIRLHSALRRSAFADCERVLRYEDVELDLQRYKVKRSGDLIQLSTAQFKLLRYLMEHPTTVFSREQLLEAVWPKKHLDMGAVTASVVRLRRALTSRGHANIIRTVPGAGYALDREASDEQFDRH